MVGGAHPCWESTHSKKRRASAIAISQLACDLDLIVKLQFLFPLCDKSYKRQAHTRTLAYTGMHTRSDLQATRTNAVNN